MRRNLIFLSLTSLAVACLPLASLVLTSLKAEVVSLQEANSFRDGGKQNQFIRGDSNCDGKVDVTDPAFLLNYLFAFEPPPACLDAVDANDNGVVNVADVVAIWNLLGFGGPPIPPPYPEPGYDPTEDDLTCESTCPYPPDTAISTLDTLWAGEMIGSPGQSGIPVVIYGSAQDTTQSYSISLCFDQAKLQVDSMSLAGTLVDSVWGLQQMGADLHNWDNDEGWCKVVVAYPFNNPKSPPFLCELPPFTHRPLAVVYLSIWAGVSVPDTVLLDLENGCGDIENVFSTQDFTSILPVLIDGNLIVQTHSLSLTLDPPSPQVMDEGDTLAIVVIATDSNPYHMVTLSTLGLPSFSSGWDERTDTGTVVDTLILTPDYCDAGYHGFSFHANCSGGYSTDSSFSLTVNNINRPPTIEAGPERIIVAGDSVSFLVTATDLDYGECRDDTLNLNVTGLPSGMSFEVASPISWLFTWVPTQADTGIYSLILTAEDLYGASDSDTLIIEVVVQAPFPYIRSILDVPNDQGRQVRIHWLGSLYDGPDTTYTITQYAIWRRVDNFSGGQGGEIEEVADLGVMLRSLWRTKEGSRYRIAGGKEIWDYIATIPAHHNLEYAHVSPTLADSTSEGISYSVFFVSAHTPDPDIFFDSPPDSGYSIDNLAPSPPQGLMATVYEGSTILSWEPNFEEDLAYYAIYRGSYPDFESDTPLDYIADTTYTDPTVGCCYKVSAFDFAGNESELSDPVNVEEMGISSQLPPTFVLWQNYPNPFNPVTEIRYSLPKDGYVTIHVYDLLGQKVATLVDERQAAGFKSVTWNATPFPSGIYFYHIQAEKSSQTRKMILIK